MTLLLRLGLLLTGTWILVLVIQSVMNSFDVLGITSNNSTSNRSPPIWTVFLGGEFTFSCMFQIGYHMIQACVKGGRSLSTFVVLSTMVGVVLGQIITGQMLIVDEIHTSVAFLLVIVYIITDSRGGESKDTKSSGSLQKLAFYSPVRILVKVGSLLLIMTGILVLGMGLTVKQPSDIIPQLFWNGFGYEYNLLQTFGAESVQSSEFFAMLLCTMLGTICQTLCAGIWIWRSSIGSISCQQGLGFACSGVSLIVFSNSISASQYNQMQFTDGRECMIAHILLLIQTNVHVPAMWLIHELWINTALPNPNDLANMRKQKRN